MAAALFSMQIYNDRRWHEIHDMLVDGLSLLLEHVAVSSTPPPKPPKPPKPHSLLYSFRFVFLFVCLEKWYFTTKPTVSNGISHHLEANKRTAEKKKLKNASSKYKIDRCYAQTTVRELSVSVCVCMTVILEEFL